MAAIIFFAYFYISIVFRPDDIADNMRKFGGFIPGIRPGKRTSDFINDVLTRITLVGALYLIIITIIPDASHLRHSLQHHLWLIGPRPSTAFQPGPTQGLGVNFYFGGTSLLIVVGVAMDTRQPDRVSTHHAPLRRLLPKERSHQGPSQLVTSRRFLVLKRGTAQAVPLPFRLP